MHAMKRHLALPALLLVALLAACSSAPGSTPSPGTPRPTTSTSPIPTVAPSPTPIPTPGAGEVTSAAQAAALVFAANPMFSGIAPLQPDLIGQSAWYEASETADGYGVVVTIGSGDCMAGCIDRRTWTYAVARDGNIELVSEEGDEVEIPGGEGATGPATITVRMLAGPVCPVERDPPDSNCAPRAVANAEAVLRNPAGQEVGRGVSDANGHITFSVPAGAYYVEPGPVEGLMGQAAAVALSAPPGSTSSVVVAYDTGIR
jgi:hypothetical protein